MEKIKYVHRQDCAFKLSAGNSGETSLNLSNEIFDLIAKGSMQLGEEKDVTFKIYKEDCIKAICFIILKLPLYQSSSNSSTKIEDGISIFQKLIDKVNSIFGNKECVDYTVNLYYRTDGRIYLNRLKVEGFSIRDVLVENNSALLFREEPGGQIALRILSDIQEGEDKKAERIINDRTLSTFILSVISYFEKEKGLTPIATYAQNVNKGNPIKVSAPNLFNLVGMFIETSIEDIRSRNSDHTRWFEKEFELGGKKVYLSTQWNAKGNYQLTLPDFIKLIRHCYGEIYSYKLNNGVHELYVTRENEADLGPRLQILFQFDDATKFVWECIKLFNKNKELKQLFSSNYRTNGGSTGNYIRINECFVAQLGHIDIEGFESIYTDEEGYINNGFDAREVDKFAVAINDVFAGCYKVVIEDNLYKLIKLQNGKQVAPQCKEPALISQDYQYMSAIKTKPFLILGGFSGTGKSIAVKSLAFATCPCDGYLNTSETSPGNYLLLSVKPNWHDATEITGFRSSVNRNYYVTDFMKFVIKAKLYEKQNVPFFVCLDEMNLAPVEEYFADFLSVIESRTKRQDEKIVTDALISKSVFNDSNYADDFNIFLEIGIHPTVEVNDITDFNARLKESKEDAFYQEQWLVDELKEQGMTIPQNLVVIGTVNMDDTTNSFSRKVIDRAMTFETVVGEFDVDDYFAEGSGLLMEYCQNPTKGELYISDKVRATDLSSEYLNEDEKGQIINFINNINKDLDGTPFQISYRVLNETILLYRSKKEIDRILDGKYGQNVEFSLGLNNIFDDILMQKILPRIEGDYDKCHTAIENLSRRAKDSDWKRSVDKLAFMEHRFGPDKSGFTSFWN